MNEHVDGDFVCYGLTRLLRSPGAIITIRARRIRMKKPANQGHWQKMPNSRSTMPTENSACAAWNRAVERWREACSKGRQVETPDEDQSAREMVRFWLRSLAPNPVISEPMSPSKEYSALQRVIATVLSCVEDDLVNEEEAEALVEVVVAKFIDRRFEKILRKVMTPSRGNWFALASGQCHARQREDAGYRIIDAL